MFSLANSSTSAGGPLELKGRRLDGNVETFRPSKSLFRAHEYEERVQVLLFLPQSNPGAMNDNINWVNIVLLGMTYQSKNHLMN